MVRSDKELGQPFYKMKNLNFNLNLLGVYLIPSILLTSLVLNGLHIIDRGSTLIIITVSSTFGLISSLFGAIRTNNYNYGRERSSPDFSNSATNQDALPEEEGANTERNRTMDKSTPDTG